VPPAHDIQIDGQFADWAAIQTVPSDCKSCQGSGEVHAVRVTRTPDDRIAIYGETRVAPRTTTDDSYRVLLAPLSGPLYVLALRVGVGEPTASLERLDANGTPIDVVGLTGLSIEAAFGSSGFELAMPIAALPFASGLTISTVWLETLSGGEWITNQMYSQAESFLCWDASSPLCQPS
jgi:hypothetical protein